MSQGQQNVMQPGPQVGVGFGPVVKFQEVYVLHTEANNTLAANITAPIALGDAMSQTAENVVSPAVAGDGFRPAGLAAYEAVINSTGIYGYKPQAGDPLAVYQKGRFVIVNVDGVVAFGAELVASATYPGGLRARPGGNVDPTWGICRVSNEGIANNPITADIDTTVVQMNS